MLEIKKEIYYDDDWYDEYIQILKDGKEIHYGESFELPKYENGKKKFILFRDIIFVMKKDMNIHH